MQWVLTFHIFFIVSWFAGIFYLPRIFVNLAMVEDEPTYQHLLLMANKLYRFMLPLAILAVVFGLWLLSYNVDYYLSQKWMHAKLAFVILLISYHFICGLYLNIFRRRENVKHHVFFRWFNEAPVFILLFITILVVVKPF